MEAVVAVAPENVLYFSGALIHTQALIRRRRAAVIIPMSGEPALVVAAVERALAERFNELPVLLTYEDSAESVVDTVIDYLALGERTHQVRLGVESDALSMAEADALRSAGAVLVPIDHIADELRCRKTQHELATIKLAATVLDRAIAGAAAITRAGMTEETLARRIGHNVREIGGGEFSEALGLVASGPNLWVSHHVADMRELQVGEFLRIGCRAVFRGYHAIVVRTGFVGHRVGEHAGAYERLRLAHAELLESLKLGLSGSSVYEGARKSRQRLGLELRTAHVGHGIGLEFQECPRLDSHSDDILEAGSTIVAATIAPIPGVGHMYIEDMVLLGSGETEVLSDYSDTRGPLLVQP